MNNDDDVDSNVDDHRARDGAPHDATERTVLAFDHGTRRIGVALAGPLGVIIPLPVMEVKAGADSVGKDVVARAVEAVHGHGATEVVVGIPRHYDPTSADRCEAFARALEAALGKGTPVHRQDEALTSWEAEKGIRARGGRYYDKGRIDQASAAIILRDFLAKEGGAAADETSAPFVDPIDTTPEGRERDKRRARRDATRGRGRGRARDAGGDGDD